MRCNQNVLDDMIEAAVQALLGFSQIECVRPFFSFSLPLQGDEEKENKERKSGRNAHSSSSSSSDIGTECSVTAVHVVLSVIRSRPNIAANCLGLLMNACLDPSPSSSSSSSPSVSTSGGQAPILGSSIKEILVSAGGVELGTAGISLASTERLNFFEKECPQGKIKEIKPSNSFLNKSTWN